jgi:hypothetical protein
LPSSSRCRPSGCPRHLFLSLVVTPLRSTPAAGGMIHCPSSENS